MDRKRSGKVVMRMLGGRLVVCGTIKLAEKAQKKSKRLVAVTKVLWVVGEAERTTPKCVCLVSREECIF